MAGPAPAPGENTGAPQSPGSLILCHIPSGVSIASVIAPGVQVQVVGHGYLTAPPPANGKYTAFTVTAVPPPQAQPPAQPFPVQLPLFFQSQPPQSVLIPIQGPTYFPGANGNLPQQPQPPPSNTLLTQNGSICTNLNPEAQSFVPTHYMEAARHVNHDGSGDHALNGQVQYNGEVLMNGNGPAEGMGENGYYCDPMPEHPSPHPMVLSRSESGERLNLRFNVQR